MLLATATALAHADVAPADAGKAGICMSKCGSGHQHGAVHGAHARPECSPKRRPPSGAAQLPWPSGRQGWPRTMTRQMPWMRSHVVSATACRSGSAALAVSVVTVVSVFMRAEIAVVVIPVWSGRSSRGGQDRSSSGGRRGSTKKRIMSGDCAVTVTVAAAVVVLALWVSAAVKPVVVSRSWRR